MVELALYLLDFLLVFFGEGTRQVLAYNAAAVACHAVDEDVEDVRHKIMYAHRKNRRYPEDSEAAIGKYFTDKSFHVGCKDTKIIRQTNPDTPSG